jgi:hypothetical protein
MASLASYAMLMHGADGHAAAAPPSSVMNLRRPKGSLSLLHRLPPVSLGSKVTVDRRLGAPS